MKKEIGKFAAKMAIGATLSAVIGYIIKTERELNASIDKKWPTEPFKLFKKN